MRVSGKLFSKVLMIASWLHFTSIFVRRHCARGRTGADSTLTIVYVQSNVLRKLNPLVNTIRIPAPPTSASNPIPSQAVYNRVFKYLGELLEAEWRSKQNPRLTKFSSKELIKGFKHQFKSYSLLRYPFDRPLKNKQSIRSWWCSLLDHPDAEILAVSIFIVVFYPQINRYTSASGRSSTR